MTSLADDAQSIFRAGVDRVRGDALMRHCVSIDDDEIRFDEWSISRRDIDRVIVCGGGKASGAMAIGLVERLAGEIEIAGHVNVPEGCDLWPQGARCPSGLRLFAARPAGINEPTAEAIEGTNSILRWVETASERDLVVVLISGGGSALFCRPIDGITLSDKLAVIRHLSGAGAEISQINTVRKHLSGVKGGRLAQACRSARMITLVLSDVLGDPLDLIASGPTVADPSRPSDALEVLSQFDPLRTLPQSVYQCLEEASRDPQSLSGSALSVDRPLTDSPVLVVGNNAVAVDAAGLLAERLGYNHVMQSSRQSEGLAEEVGRHLADLTIEMLLRDPTEHRQDALITGGEPVVRLVKATQRGRGGRNQQLVLAAYDRLVERRIKSDQWDRLTILSGGTDGEDGPTDAAGAFIDGTIHARVVELGLRPDIFLSRNDAYTFFERTGGLLMTGPTGTNVCDLRVALVR